MGRSEILEEGKIRMSRGSAFTLGLVTLDYKETRKRLLERSLTVATTIYLLLYSKKRCSARCAFCTQTSSKLTDFSITDIQYPAFPIEIVAERIAEAYSEGIIKNVCSQTICMPNHFEMIRYAAEEIRKRSSVAITVCTTPAPKKSLLKLKPLNLARFTISMDCATPEVFSKIKGEKAKGPFRWESHIQGLKDAVEVFGKFKVGTHLMIGLGETEAEALSFIQQLFDIGIASAIGPLLPVVGTGLENYKQPPIESYRKIQLARYLIYQKKVRVEDMKFNKKGILVDFGVPKQELIKLIEAGTPFLSICTGCGGLKGACNRPFVADTPNLIYNFPRDITADELAQIKRQVQMYF
ncbi:radical SAM protein [Candidatus Omnitrophota bacterium]